MLECLYPHGWNAFNFWKANDWLDRGTRAVQIKFLMFNPNYGVFTNVAILVEFTPAGSVIPSFRMSSMKLETDEQTQETIEKETKEIPDEIFLET